MTATYLQPCQGEDLVLWSLLGGMDTHPLINIVNCSQVPVKYCKTPPMQTLEVIGVKSQPTKFFVILHQTEIQNGVLH